jgi:V/A-type H+/Na+-transporting ATPase subunit E
MPIWGQVELLSRAIAEEGHREVEKLLAQALTEAERMVAEARDQAEKHYEEEVLSSRSKAHAEARRMVDTAELEARRRVTAFRRQVLQEVLDALEERLKRFRNEPAYGDFLVSAVREAIEHLAGKEFVVELEEQDVEAVQERIEETARELSVTIEVRRLTAFDGGVRVYTADQRLLFDNSLAARLKRNEDAIRQEIWREIFGTER